jgi:hypothetical protein
MIGVKDAQDFWETLVEDNAKLGYVQNVVPVAGLSIERAQALAVRTKSKFEIAGSKYVFVHDKQ